MVLQRRAGRLIWQGDEVAFEIGWCIGELQHWSEDGVWVAGAGFSGTAGTVAQIFSQRFQMPEFVSLFVRLCHLLDSGC